MALKVRTTAKMLTFGGEHLRWRYQWTRGGQFFRESDKTALDIAYRLRYYKYSMAPIYDDIRKAIKASDKSRYVIARETGVSESHLSQFMDRTKGLSVESLERVADSLGLDITTRPKRRKKGR